MLKVKSLAVLDGILKPYLLPQVMEPDKCAEWTWVSWEEMTSWTQDGHGGKGDGNDGPPSGVMEAVGTREQRARRLFMPLKNLLSRRPGLNPVKVLLLG